MQKFKSRKFWLAVGTVFSIAIAAATGVTIEPAAIAGIVVMATGYVVAQGNVDKGFVVEQIKVQGDVGRARIEGYAKQLEEELTKVMAQLEYAQGPALTPVPEEEA